MKLLEVGKPHVNVISLGMRKTVIDFLDGKNLVYLQYFYGIDSLVDCFHFGSP